MNGSIMETTTETLPLVARGVGVVLAAVAGTSVEVNGLHRLASDLSLTGLWVAWVGVLLLYAGYVLATDLGVRLRSSEPA